MTITLKMAEMNGTQPNPVYTANALHQAGGIPGNVIVYYHVGAMQVNALGQYLCGDDDVEIIFLFH